MRWPWQKKDEIVLNERRMRALDLLADMLEAFEEGGPGLAESLVRADRLVAEIEPPPIETPIEEDPIRHIYETDEEFLASLDESEVGEQSVFEPEVEPEVEEEFEPPAEATQRRPEEIETIAFGEAVLPRSEDAPAPNARLGDETPEMLARRKALLQRPPSVEVPGEEF